MKKFLTLFICSIAALTLSACCFLLPAPAPAPVASKAPAPAAVAPAPAPVVVAPAPAPAPKQPTTIEEKTRIAIDVHFETNKANIKDESNADIKKLAVFMQTYPQTSTVVEGHTDNIGSAAMNKDLSQRRAEAVRAELINKYGIDPNRLGAVGYGFDRPVADNATAEGRAKNRRTEAVIETIVIKRQE